MSAQKFGRYVIKGELGRGGMATVFHAYDPRFERDVAIKVLPREFLHDPQFRTRFEREAKTIALIEHPAIVPVYDFGDEEGQPYIVMRYMSGGSLSDWIAKGPLTTHEVINMINRLAPALDAAHGKGIIHRDLKPGNILFDQYGNSFLSDFGIARLQQASSATLTGGAILGTPAYMSPEQIQGVSEIDGRSDIYSLGVILFQILSGQVPYYADTAAKLMMMHILEPVPQITNVKEDLPEAFNDVIEKAMAKDPLDRYQSAEAMARAVELAARAADMPTIIGELAGEASEIPTNYRPGATVLSPAAHKREVHSKAKTHAISATAKPPADSKQIVQPVAEPQRRISTWVWLVGALAVAGILFGVFTLGGGMKLISSNGTATLPPTEIVAATLTYTPVPSDTPTPPPISSDTPAPTYTSTDIPTSTITATLPPATETPTFLPLAPMLGGSDTLAFISDNDIYIVNLDGSNLVRITSDGGAKSHLQWTPDGSSIAYITGLCIKMANYQTTRVDNVLCFEYASSLDAFEISPDGQQLAIVVNHSLYVVPLDLERLAQVDYWDDIQAMATCESLAPYAASTGAPYSVREVHWSNNMQKLALVVPIPEGGVQVEVVRVINISQCVDNLGRVDEFPSTRFTMSGYENNPRLLHVGYDGLVLYALTTIIRNEGYGDLYFYNMDVYQAQIRVNPIKGHCCYRDPDFSPDGSYLTFAFQDIGLGSQSVIELYYIPYGTIGTGLNYTPIPLPDNLLTNQRESPQPVLRPATGLP